jgi:hypothetical protein
MGWPAVIADPPEMLSIVSILSITEQAVGKATAFVSGAISVQLVLSWSLNATTVFGKLIVSLLTAGRPFSGVNLIFRSVIVPTVDD